MGWLYVIVRTFPFWAVPLAFTLLASWYSAQKKEADANNKKIAKFYLFMGIMLFIFSGVYLYFQGYKQAVPLLYEVLNAKKLGE